MSEKFLREAVGVVVGKHAEEIAKFLDSQKYINEFIIAKKLDMTINQTRNILYKLADSGLVSSIRKKDKKKGWFTYFWKSEMLKCFEFLRDILQKKMEAIKIQIKTRESKQFYVCENCGIEVAEETALLYNFTCNECGNVFALKDNVKVLKELKRNLDRLSKELELINGEIIREKEKTGKKREKEMKKVLKERQEARQKVREKMKKERQKLSKKNIPKKSASRKFNKSKKKSKLKKKR